MDLLTALEAAAIEQLDVDEDRAIAIYQSAILMLIAIDGRATTARSFDVVLWQGSPHDSNCNPDDLISAFVNELLATTKTTRH